jgi:hypothetical protein
MFTPDLFPAELAAAQRENSMSEPGPDASGEATGTEGNDSIMGTAPTSGPDATSLQGIYEQLPGHGTEASELTPTESSESRELLSQDDKREEPERYWFWDDDEYARDVCVKRTGEI